MFVNLNLLTDNILLLLTIFFLLLFFKFIREYTSKVDDLIKDKIEAQNEEKAKEKEEKDVIAQQVLFSDFLLCDKISFIFCLGFYLLYDKITFNTELTVLSMISRICMPSCCHLLCRRHQCQEWGEGLALPHPHHLWVVEWGCRRCLLLACLQWATDLLHDDRAENFAINFTGEAR